MFKSVFHLVIVSLLSCAHVTAQDVSKYRFETINSYKGLSNNGVWDVEVDKFGFLWVATVDGLCRLETPDRTKVYSEEDNLYLKSSNIRTLFSDSKNNLWIGTKHDGLTVYNQNDDTWQYLGHDPSNPNSLVNDEVLNIMEDSNGKIWIGTENGFSIYDTDTEEFINYTQQRDKENALKGKAILKILEDNEGRIWIGTWGSGMYLVMYEDENRDLKKLSFKNLLPVEGIADDNNIWTLFQDNRNRYWIGTFGSGLYHMKLPENISDIASEQDWSPIFQSIRSMDNNALIDVNVTDIVTDDDHNMWVSTTNGLNNISATDIDILLSDDSKVIRRKGMFNYIRYSPSDPYSIPNTTIYKLAIDNQGLLWLGTTSGVGKFNLKRSQFITYNLDRDYASKLYGQNLHVTDDRKAWISDAKYGLVRYDFNTKEKTKYQDIIGDDVDFGIVYSIYEKDQQLYVLTEENILIINLDNYNYETYSLTQEQAEYINHVTIQATIVDSRGIYYIGTDNGLLVNDLSKSGFSIYKNISGDETSVVDNSVTQILEDYNNDLWFSTYNGLSHIETNGFLDYSNLVFKNYKYNSLEPDGLCNNQITCITEVDKVIYLGLTSGICSYNIETEKFKFISGKGENYYVASLAYDGNNTIWGTAMDGIFSLDIATGNLIMNSEDVDISYNKYIPLSTKADSNAHVYFATINGIIELDPKKIRYNDVRPEVYVTDIKVISSSGEKVKSGLNLDKLELNKQDYLISFNFAATNYIQNHKNKYAYRLSGFEEKWNYPENNMTSATYTNLDAGEYTFEVKASNNEGLWNEEGCKLPIVREPALTETILFKLLSILLAILLILLGVKGYTRAVRLRAQEMEKLVSERTQELAEKNNQVEELLSKIQFRNSELEEIVAQRTENLLEANNDLKRSNSDLEQFAYIASHDLQEPLRTIGTFTSLLGRKLKGNLDDASQEYFTFIVDGVQRMSNLIKSILTYSSVGKELNIDKVDLNNILSSKIKDLSKRINEVNAHVTVSDLPVVNCDGTQIGMVFYNLINNGIKFNKKDTPTISVNYIPDQSDFYTFSVRDNGIGIQKEYQDKIFELFNRLHLKSEYEGTGIGLTLCERIITKHEGKIWLESEEGTGTTFYFSISKNITRDK